jgi:thiol-disulfide isomerase/thioredoxin
MASIWDVLALLAIAFAVWKIFIAPRSLDPANAQPAPHASYERLDGGTFDIADQRGKLLFLDFYASWCEPCKIETPMVERWARAHPETLVVPVDVGEPPVVARAFAKRYGLRDVVLDRHSTAGPFFGVAGFPTIVVIDPQGRIRAKWEGLNPAIAMAMTNAQRHLAAR